ncbi:MAG TPA: hypothetical protein ENK31_04120 [Nannocystis exedens]|nr:hypothetical protein [Nannocystis exedens]
MPRARNFFWLFSTAFAVVSACFTGDAAQDLPCKGDEECGLALVCVRGLCAAPGSEPCGNELINTGEECDEGEANGPGSSCTESCKINICGDGIVGPSERCDSEDRSICTENCEVIVFADDIENNSGDWTHEVADEPVPACVNNFCFEDQWQRTPNVPMVEGHPDGVSTFAWYSGNLTEVRGGASSRLISPEIDLREVEAPISLSFYHYYHFKLVDGVDKKSDGSVVEIMVDGGEWQEYDLGDYIDKISLGMDECPVGQSEDSTVWPNPLGGREAFTGRVTSWLQVKGSLDEFAGHTIRLGFRIASDCSSNTDAYVVGGEIAVVELYVDNVEVLGGRPSLQ